MNSSFYNGISGIKSHQFGLDVQANNIANISTIGFKGSTQEFSSIFSTAMQDSYFDSTLNDKGMGTRASATALNMNQGILQSSDNVFDLAIGKEGWFGVKSSANQTLYTRAGEFSIDTNGDMVDANGNYLLGTLGENISPITLSDEIIEEFGRYYNKDGSELGKANQIDDINDIQLNAVENQTKINLPDILYSKAEATTYVNYQANLNPKKTTEVTQIVLNDLDINQTIDPSGNSLSIDGTIQNTPQLLNPKVSETVSITITDINGKSIQLNTTLDSDLNWKLSNEDVSMLDTSNPLITTAAVQTMQEVPNVEHFTTEIISPDGKKNFIDMTFTKRVPQEILTTTWDAKIELLSFHETYNPAKTYDENIYKVDKEQYKVYSIIDSQVGDASFVGSGQLMQSNMPTLSNQGEPLTLNIGQPYEEINLNAPDEPIIEDGFISFSGTSDLARGESVNVEFIASDGSTKTATGKVEEDGSWKALSKYEDTTIDSVTKTYSIVHSGYDGMVSNVDLDKSRVSQKDGVVEGLLKTYNMDSRGNVVAEFDNGKSIPIAKIAVYHFQNDQGLEAVGGTNFIQTVNSGNAIFYTNENGENILGSQIFSNNLESSNVNFATALTELIVMQKAFDASSKSITTSDQMIQNAINMKR